MKHIQFPGLGIDLKIKPEIFSIGNLSIRWYGLIIAIGFALAVWYCLKRSPKFGIKQDHLIDMLLIATPAAIIGARLYYVVLAWDQYASNPIRALYIWEGGIAIYGAIIFAALAAWIFARVKKINAMNLFDIGALGLLIGQAVGRWGNFVNGEVFGIATDLPWGMRINYSQAVHPLFFYEFLWNMLGFVLFHFMSKRRRFYGQIFWSYVAWYGIGRGLLEGIRAEQDILYFFDSGLKASQVVGFLSALVALGILAYRFIFSSGSEPILLLTPEEAAAYVSVSTPKNDSSEEIVAEEAAETVEIAEAVEPVAADISEESDEPQEPASREKSEEADETEKDN